MKPRHWILAALVFALPGCVAPRLPVPRGVSALGASSLSRPDAARRQARAQAEAGLALLFSPQMLPFELRRVGPASRLELGQEPSPVDGAEVSYVDLPGGGVLARASAVRSPEAVSALEGLAEVDALVRRSGARPELGLLAARRQALRALVLRALGPGNATERVRGVLGLIELSESLGPEGVVVEARGCVRVLERGPLDAREAEDLVREVAAELEGLEEVVRSAEEAAGGEAQRMP